MKHLYPWKTFFILLFLSLVSVICIFPYVLTVQADVINQINIPLGDLVVAQFFQSLLLFSLAVFFGLLLLPKIKFSLPFQYSLKKIFVPSVSLGIAVAVVIFVLDSLFTFFGVAITTHKVLAPPWQTLLAAVYGGISEEVLMRLFIMSLFIWIGMKLSRQNSPSSVVILVSNVLAAVIFGLGHLPITASIRHLDLLTIIRAVVLNGVGGVIFGWLFWKKGLESAMLSHFTADIFLLTLLPIAFK